jgi:hypothetical protein
MRSFVDAILRGNIEHGQDAPFSDGLRAQQGLAAVQRSATHEGWVSLSDL